MKLAHASYVLLILLSWWNLISCTDSSDGDKIEVSEGRDLKEISNGRGVMMQAFYWDVEPRFAWWDNVSSKIEDWSEHGVDKIWLPPPSKGQSGGYSMGYDPSDYFDLGEYNQHGTIETRFGSKTELISLIERAHSKNIEVIADIVLGHNSGGGLQPNPYRLKDTYTLFNTNHGNASGKFNRSYEDYHPNSFHNNDEEALFFEEQDLCHHQDNVQNWFWKNDDSVAKYYKNVIGFDGWRFDYVKSFGPQFVKAWIDEVGGWSVGEFFDGNADLVRDWMADSGTKAFDFPCLFRMKEAFAQNDLSILRSGDMLWKTHSEQAVTFVANHDTDREPVIAQQYKRFAYAFLLTHPGYPTIFYTDYENVNLKLELQNLMLINGSLATGELEVLYADSDEYIALRKGNGINPGLVLYINRSGAELSREVTTHWTDADLYDYAGHISSKLNTDQRGVVQLKAPRNGYAIWSLR
jgi:alpha-amylase